MLTQGAKSVEFSAVTGIAGQDGAVQDEICGKEPRPKYVAAKGMKNSITTCGGEQGWL